MCQQFVLFYCCVVFHGMGIPIYLAIHLLRFFLFNASLLSSGSWIISLPVSIQPSGDSVTLSESSAIISHGTTGLVTWNAALYLAEWAIENPAAFTHR